MPVASPPNTPKRLSLSFVYANFGPGIVQQLGEDDSCRHVFPQVAEKIRRKSEDFGTQTEYMAEVVTPVMDEFLKKACPSARSRPQIAQWVCREYLSHSHNGRPVLAEDLYKIGDNIAYFDSLKNSPAFTAGGASPDLLQYKTYAAFEAMLEPFIQIRERRKALAAEFNMSPADRAALLAGTTILYDGPEGRVVVPHTPEASRYWGNNTKWCISGREHAATHFPQYNARSPVIMILPRGQTDNKIALVDCVLYNSADAQIEVLPEPHHGLLQKCLAGLSAGARRNIARWMPENSAGHAPPPIPPAADSVPAAVKKELAKIQSGKQSDPALWRDRAFVLEAVRQNWLAFWHAAEELRQDRAFVLEAVRQNGLAFYYAADELKQDRAFVLEAVRQNGLALCYAADELKQDPAVVLEAVRQDGGALQYAAAELKQDRALVLEAVRQNGLALYYAAAELKQDRALVLEAVRQDGGALQYAAAELKQDRALVLEAVRRNGLALYYAADELKQDRHFIIRLLEETDGFSFQIDPLQGLVWQPDAATLAAYQLKDLERMLAKGETEKFRQHARHFKAAWGDADTLFAADPAATLKKIRADAASQYPPQNRRPPGFAPDTAQGQNS